MKTIEYRGVVSKEGWSEGPWHDEPDKVQWQDEATRLPCLIVRGPGGNWCGYVGVTKGHPFFEVEYNDCPLGEKCPERVPADQGGTQWCDHRAESALDAHGGITFSGKCAGHDADEWNKWRMYMESRRDEARKFPLGDAARDHKQWAAELFDFDAWRARMQAVRICHLPEAGETDDVWWFGFDCAHHMDRVPGYEALSLARGQEPFILSKDAVYRDLDYVKNEVRELARQLATCEGKA